MLTTVTRAMCLPRLHIMCRGNSGEGCENKGSQIKGHVFKNLKPKKPIVTDKITVVGAGQVGIACCMFILGRRLTSELCLMDLRKPWIEAEALDLLHCSTFFGNPKITTTTDGCLAKDSKYIVITAGARPKIGGTRLDIANDSAKMMKSIIPPLVKNSPNAIYIIVSNPADVMCYLVQKIGKLKRERCFSTGCHLDSLRFQYYIAKRLDVSPSAVTGYIIGEHGNSSVPVWTSVNVGGVPLVGILPEMGTADDFDNWAEVHKSVVEAAPIISKGKGYTNWGIGAAVSDVISLMKENSGAIASVGTNVKGFHCIQDDVVLSLPCVLTSEGISQILELPLSDWELEKLEESVKSLIDAQNSVEAGDCAGKGKK